MNFEIAPKETEFQANWNDAKFACFLLNVNNKTGWRLPTKEELNEIYESGKILGNHWYWSSSDSKYDANSVWVQDFSKGFKYYGNKTKDLNRVRAVRDL